MHRPNQSNKSIAKVMPLECIELHTMGANH